MVSIRIHCLSPHLDELLVLNRCTTWAFITAWNPIDKEPHLLTDNVENNQSLLEHCNSQGGLYPLGVSARCTRVATRGILLMIGISKEDATIMARKCNQHAFVFGKYKRRAELCQLSEEPNDNFSCDDICHHTVRFASWKEF